MPIEVYRGKLILYGCGDLINDYEGIGPHGGMRSDVGCLYFATLAAGSGRLEALDVVPLRLQRFALHSADAAARDWIEGQFAAHARDFAAPLRRRTEGGWHLHWSAPR
jgi:poly-gamma-glutamate synthesis protein (capsule biosynthesis protein)